MPIGCAAGGLVRSRQRCSWAHRRSQPRAAAPRLDGADTASDCEMHAFDDAEGDAAEASYEAPVSCGGGGLLAPPNRLTPVEKRLTGEKRPWCELEPAAAPSPSARLSLSSMPTDLSAASSTGSLSTLSVAVGLGRGSAPLLARANAPSAGGEIIGIIPCAGGETAKCGASVGDRCGEGPPPLDDGQREGPPPKLQLGGCADRPPMRGRFDPSRSYDGVSATAPFSSGERLVHLVSKQLATGFVGRPALFARVRGEFRSCTESPQSSSSSVKGSAKGMPVRCRPLDANGNKGHEPGFTRKK